MALKSLNTLATKLALLLLICVAVSAAPPVEAEELDRSATEKSTFSQCMSFFPESTTCVMDVIINGGAPHMSCCRAISKLNDCSSSLLNIISTSEMSLIKNDCASWGITIP